MALGFRYGRYRAARHFGALLGFRDFRLQENEYGPEALKVRSQIVPCGTAQFNLGPSRPPATHSSSAIGGNTKIVEAKRNRASFIWSRLLGVKQTLSAEP